MRSRRGTRAAANKDEGKAGAKHCILGKGRERLPARTAQCMLACFLSCWAWTLAGCSESKVYKIGVSQCSRDDWRMKMNEEIEREILSREDAVVEIRSADDNNAKQIADIRYFERNGFDIIIVAPNEAAALTPVVKEVYGRGVPVIVFDRNIVGDTYTARIGVDNEEMGRSAAHYALHMTGGGARAIEISGLEGSTPAEGRHAGFAKEFAAGGGRLLASAAGNWNKEEAIPVADSLLTAYPDVNLIYAHNDRMAIGASEVAVRHGMRDRVKIIGIDAAPDIGIRAVADSVIDATFLYPTEGHRLIQTALAILKGEPFRREVLLPVSSAVDLTNADILLLQDETLKQETDKIRDLKDRIDVYWTRYRTQKALSYASVSIIVLLLGVGLLLFRTYRQHARYQKTLTRQNKLLEEERNKQRTLNERLQAATQEKLAFFTNISHDLRTPLTLIAEPVSQMTEADNLTERQHVLIKMADKNVRILRRLINQILDFRKYENGKLDLRLTETDFGRAVREWTESFHTLARKRDIKLVLETPAPEETPRLAMDTEKMERVFFNLLSNAFKYTPAGGKITVSYACDGNDLTFKVADTGEGISRRDIGKIFDRFYQADVGRPGGSGIGLSLAKAFVELHGGTISAESGQGRGSVFTVSLPVRHVEETTDSPAASIDSRETETELGTESIRFETRPGAPVVLVIDDNKDMQQLVGGLLNDEYNILTASNGGEGIKAAVKYVPDLVVCDVMMPGMDGFECCRRIKKEVFTSHVPVLMLTACSADEQRAEGYESGADGYLSKPFNGAVLKSRISSLIANRKRIREFWLGEGSVMRKEEKPAAGDIDSDFYARFLNLFKAEMGNPDLNVDSIAAKMGFERSQFYRKIKALTGYAPVELMRRLRLEQGKVLLMATEKNVSEIAYAIGFSSPAYFTKCYRDAFGETPSEARNKLAGA